MKRLNLILSVVMLGVWGWVVRLYPWALYSPVRGRYAPGVDFATWYTMQNGHLPTILPSTTYTSNLVNGTTYLGEFGRVLLNAPLLLMVGKNSLMDSLTFYAQLPWQGLVLLPAALILGCHAMIKSEAQAVAPRARELSYILTSALAFLGFPSLIQSTANSGFTDYYGWVFVGLVFYALIRRASTPDSRTKFSALLVLFMAQILIYHHTSALFLLLLILGIYLVQTRTLLRRATAEPKILKTNLVVIYAVLLTGYVTYLSFSFRGYLFSLTSAIGNLADGILGVASPSPLAVISTTNNFTLERALVRSADVGLIIVVFAYAGITFLRQRLTGVPGLAFAGYGLGTVIAAAFVIGWGGFGAFFVRISALSAFLTILGVTYILRIARRSARRSLVALCIAVILVSPLAYASSQAAQQAALRWSEASALEWTNAYVVKNATIMSDSRVATPLIYYGFTSLLGFEDETGDRDSQERLVQAYFDLYRPISTDQVARGICAVEAVSGTKVRYLIYSTYFQDPGTSVIGFLNSYPPGNSETTKILDNATWLQRVFDSGTTVSYGPIDANRTCQ